MINQKTVGILIIVILAMVAVNIVVTLMPKKITTKNGKQYIGINPNAKTDTDTKPDTDDADDSNDE